MIENNQHKADALELKLGLIETGLCFMFMFMFMFMLSGFSGD